MCADRERGDGSKSGDSRQRGAKRLLSLKEAADLLGIHPDTLQRWVAQGKVRALRIKRRWQKP
jgi:excisionase family DNA binding protein